jgi:hypothetical protein
MEFLGPIKPESPNGNKHVLVMTDAFSKWTEVIALPDQTAEKLVEPRWIKSFSIMGHRKLLLQIEGQISRPFYSTTCARSFELSTRQQQLITHRQTE